MSKNSCSTKDTSPAPVSRNVKDPDWTTGDDEALLASLLEALSKSEQKEDQEAAAECDFQLGLLYEKIYERECANSNSKNKSNSNSESDANLRRSFHRYYRSAVRGQTSGQLHVAMMYARGQGLLPITSKSSKVAAALGPGTAPAPSASASKSEISDSDPFFSISDDKLISPKSFCLGTDKKTVFAWELAAAIRGNVTAAFNLSIKYRTVYMDLKKAFQWCEKAANKKFKPAEKTAIAADADANKTSSSTDVEMASTTSTKTLNGVEIPLIVTAAHIEKTEKFHCAEANYNLGLMYYIGVDPAGESTKSDISIALSDSEEAFVNAYLSSETKFPADSNTGTVPAVPADPKRALICWLTGAQLGNVKCMYNLGLMYTEDSTGIKADNDKAEKWLKMGAEAGFDEAQFSLATLLMKSESEKKFWLEQAAKQGHSGAELLLSKKSSTSTGQKAKK